MGGQVWEVLGEGGGEAGGGSALYLEVSIGVQRSSDGEGKSSLHSVSDEGFADVQCEQYLE